MNITKMTQFGFRQSLASFPLLSLLAVILTFSLPAVAVHAQDVALCGVPEDAISGAYITVNGDQEDPVNVRSGPNSYRYEKVGVLFTYESAPALGRSPGGDWIQISCPAIPGGTGWIYAANVKVTGSLPVIDLPATSVPSRPAVDPMLAAEFPTAAPTATRLPTFTPAAPQPAPTFRDMPTLPLNGRLLGILSASSVVIGGMVFLFSFIRKD